MCLYGREEERNWTGRGVEEKRKTLELDREGRKGEDDEQKVKEMRRAAANEMIKQIKGKTKRKDRQS